jgi:para-aminobenzoate synthetase / 4-amino-4-deoxychorismate lyase
MFEHPVEVVRAERLDEVLPALRRVQAAVDGGLHAAGFVAYEAAPAFDPAMRVTPQSGLPLVWFGTYRASSPVDEMPGRGTDYEVGEWTSAVDESSFAAGVASIRESIASGDVYQVNYTGRLRANFDGDPSAWYRRLRDAQGAGYAAYLDLGRFHLLSLSPELFFRVSPIETNRPSGVTTGGAASGPTPAAAPARAIVTRPMKGTHRRGRWTEEDRDFERRLRESDKERAENLMIVDLVRNDLGRVAETGSVRVEELFTVERYPTLLQMTSTISARLRPDVGLPEMFGALFPCGSVTGAPKIAAMRRIAELEPEPRGAYCGAIGLLEPGGRMAFNVAIRTITLDRETNVAGYGVGSGITWDSCPQAEAAENRLKAAILDAAPARPDLFETLRLEDGAFIRGDRHLARITASAAYFGIPADGDAMRAALQALAREHPRGALRARLRLTAAGIVSAGAEPLSESWTGPRTFAISRGPVDRNDRMLFHKIADRSVYAARRSERPDAYDVLLCNQEGELTEFTIGTLVAELDGALCTPPLDCGLLPGVLRAELLESGAVRERVLLPADLQRASRIWLVNSLRGWLPMAPF